MFDFDSLDTISRDTTFPSFIKISHLLLKLKKYENVNNFPT